jgi:drug/metabolite transporter (DMT)-like permease
VPGGSQTRAYVALLLIVALWGSFAPTSKLALAAFPPFFMVTVRMLIASGFLVVRLGRLGDEDVRALGARDLPTFLFLGLMGFFGSMTLTYLGIYLTTASSAVILQTASPITVALGAWLYLGERLRPIQWAGIALSAAGVLLVVTRGRVFTVRVTDLHAGDFIQLLGITCWTVYTVYGKRVMGRYSPSVATTAAYVCGTVILLPVALLAAPAFPRPDLSSLLAWGIVSYHAVLGAVAHVWWYEGIRTIGASRAAIFTNLQPIVGLGLAALLTDEQIGLWQILGGALVLGGVVLTTTRVRPA